MKTQKPEFLKDWNSNDHEKVNNAIVRFFSGQTMVNHKTEKVTFGGSLASIEDTLGLAYTSSSSFAMLAICNTHITDIENENFHYEYLALSKEGNVFLISQDKEENEKFNQLTFYGNERIKGSFTRVSDKVKTIDVTAKEWFDRVNGNSYFSAWITVNYQMDGEQSFGLPFQGGYRDHYISEAKEELIRRGFLENSEMDLTRFCRENGIILRRYKIENCKKKEIIEFGQNK
jgi:hypothetical protein